MPGPIKVSDTPRLKLRTSRPMVVERSGYAGEPRANASNGGNALASPINANAARAGSPTIGAPVWKRSHSATAGFDDSPGSNHTGVSWSIIASANAATAGNSGTGAEATPRRGWIVPGRAVADITARNVACEAMAESDGQVAGVAVIARPRREPG